MVSAVQQPALAAVTTNTASHLASTEVDKTDISIKKKAEELNKKTHLNFGRKNHKSNKHGRKRFLPRERRKNKNGADGYDQEDLADDDGKIHYSQALRSNYYTKLNEPIYFCSNY